RRVLGVLLPGRYDLERSRSEQGQTELAALPVAHSSSNSSGSPPPGGSLSSTRLVGLACAFRLRRRWGTRVSLRRAELAQIDRLEDDLAADDRRDGLRVAERLWRQREQVLVPDREVRILARLDRTSVGLDADRARGHRRVHAECFERGHPFHSAKGA